MIDFLTNNYVEIGLAVGGIMLAADRIAKLTPTKTDDKWVARFRQIVKIVGLVPEDNPGKADQ